MERAELRGDTNAKCSMLHSCWAVRPVLVGDPGQRCIENLMASPQQVFFRAAPRPKFNIHQSALIALIMLVLLTWWADTSGWFHFQLTPAELARIQAERERRQEELVFRFLEAPEDAEAEKDARFFSDADRLRRSAPVEETQDENEDPVSVGNSYELAQSQTAPSVPPATPAQAPPPEPVAEEVRPKDDVADEPEPDPSPTERNVPIMGDQPGAPKPYRRPTREEIETARRMASQQLAASQNRNTPVVPGDAEQQYHNPQGARAERLGFSIDTAGHDLGPYLKNLIQLVRGHWRIPEIARYEVSGVAVIVFNLHQDGTITETAVLESSQHEPLDVASFNAINTIYKAPPLPAHIKEPYIPIKFSFYYNMRPRY